MEKVKKYFIILVLFFLVIFISGCINILPTLEDDSIAPGKGRLKIYLTDSSGDYKANDSETYSAVYITISRIEAHIAGDNEGDNEGVEGYWIILKEWDEGDISAKIDLIILKEEGISLLLTENELIPNKYTQLRLFVTKASVLIETKSKENKLIEVGTNWEPVEIPSAYQTGIKLIHPFEIIENGDAVLTIDFDAEKSIIKTGNENNGNYKLKPVIKVVTNIFE
ncbi:hypothetical protein CVT91_12820 [Candidatus Atribacteria bacterium HGW-Atribacteria-1]|nr:MAG: hypothetical protein CVT91_12820 [Candidatus Atribacteria bacterium HGW-Atribacteria-1]